MWPSNTKRLDRIERKLDQALSNQRLMLEKLGKEMAAMDDLTAQVSQNTSVEESAVTLIKGLAAQLAAAGTDPAKLQALQSQLAASASDLAAAVAANTPAAPPAA